MATILCVDDEPSVGVVLEHTLAKIGHRPMLVASVDDAMKAMARTSVDLVIADYVMPKLNGLDLLKLMEKEGSRIPVIIMTGYSSIENAVVSIESGASNYLTKPIRAETLEIVVNQALEHARLRKENETLRSEIHRLRSDLEAGVTARGETGRREGSPADGGEGPSAIEPPVFNLDELERQAIHRALQATGGNRTRAAKLLGISERTLRNKLNGPRVRAEEPRGGDRAVSSEQ